MKLHNDPDMAIMRERCLNLEIKYKDAEFTFYDDPGHAWIEVPRELVKFLKVNISSCSYYNKETDMVYLEEDMDAGAFFRAYEKLYFSLPKYKEIEDNIGIRQLSRTM